MRFSIVLAAVAALIFSTDNVSAGCPFLCIRHSDCDSGVVVLFNVHDQDPGRRLRQLVGHATCECIVLEATYPWKASLYG
ncbi:hypothetical protein EV702DRAFT_1150580 [Suillus placidus]|uniref:Uncharacterized protein n=1 Tax=Suillus placidus TaxID=48579 RepID=A0A9P6ZHC2_9AGAM|nr:hypothetical protein EV702DRAFT_1150580 [Suillus placidus]